MYRFTFPQRVLRSPSGTLWATTVAEHPQNALHGLLWAITGHMELHPRVTRGNPATFF